MSVALNLALNYIARGWNPVPVQYRSKIPIGEEWQRRVIGSDSAASYFSHDPLNIGVVLGATSKGLTDVDLDCAEAVVIAPYLLPPTKATFGRKSNRASHWLYVTELGTSETAVVAFADPTSKAKLLELRTGGREADGSNIGAQTVLPGSIHECGEPVTWEENDEPAKVEDKVLLTCVKRLASACLIARAWPGKGGRHSAALAVGSFLQRAGLDETEIVLMIEAITRAANDEEWKDRVRAVKDAAKHVADTDRGAGLPKLAELVGNKGARAIAEWLEYKERKWDFRGGFKGQGGPTRPDGRTGEQSQEIPPPVPLPKTKPSQRPQWPMLAEAALHGLPGEVVRQLAPHTEADPVALLLQYLTMVGNAIGRGPFIEVESDQHHTNLFSTLVGDTAKSRKGTSAGRIRAIMRWADSEWEKLRIPGSLSSGEGVIWAVRDAIYKLKDGQEELDDPGIEDKRLHFDEREFGMTLSHMKRSGNILSSILRDAWDGRERLASQTKHSPACATNPHISITAHITEDELRRALDLVSMANGFANRFLFACVRRARLLPRGGRGSKDIIRDLGVKTARAIRDARNIGEVDLTEEADAAWATIYAELSEGRPGLFGHIIARAEAQTLRLAMLYALLDGCDLIGIEHLKAGLALWQYCEASAEYIFGDLIGDPLADAILMALQRNPAGMTRDAIRDHFNRNESSAAISIALGILLTAGKVHSEERPPNRPAGTGGRPVEMWFAN